MDRTAPPDDRVPSENPQSREHRGDQDVERGPGRSPLEDHDEETTEYATDDEVREPE